MELLQLRYFLESAETLSFSQTAKKYMVPPSSVSASVKRLEKELNCTLFERTSNRIQLSQNGQRLYRVLSDTLYRLDQVVSEISGNDQQEIRILILAARFVTTNLLIRFQKLYPNLHLSITMGKEDVSPDDFDIIFDAQNDKYHNFDTIPISQCELGICAAQDSELTKRELTLWDLRNQKFITMFANDYIHQIFCDICHRAGFEPNVNYHVNDNQSLFRFIEEGLALGLVRTDSKLMRRISILNIADFQMQITICAYYRERKLHSAARTLLDFIQSPPQK